MATTENRTLTDGKDSIVIKQRTGTTVTFNTEEKYAKDNIELGISVQQATPSLIGGALTNRASAATFTNVTTSTTDNGIKIQTTNTAGRAAVTYAAAVAGWVDAAKGATPTGGAAVTASTQNGTAYFVSGVKIPVPASGKENKFFIEVPNGSTSEFIKFVFTVDSDGNTTVAEE